MIYFTLPRGVLLARHQLSCTISSSYNCHYKVELDSLREWHNIPQSVRLILIDSYSGIIKSKGATKHVRLYINMFLKGLRLPFRSQIRNILDYLGMCSTQFLPNLEDLVVQLYCSEASLEAVGVTTASK